MTKSLYLLIISANVFLLGSCGTSSTETDADNKEERDPRFAQCYYDDDLAKNKCDSVLIAFFGSKGYMHLKLNKELSFIGCDEKGDLEEMTFGDENCCLPRTYDIVYDIIYKGDTVYQIPMFAGPEMKFDFSSEEEKKILQGYGLLLEGRFKFDYADLKKFMRNENMNSELYEVALIHDTLMKNSLDAFQWEISYVTETEEMIVTRVIAMNGKYSPIRPITRIGD